MIQSGDLFIMNWQGRTIFFSIVNVKTKFCDYKGFNGGVLSDQTASQGVVWGWSVSSHHTDCQCNFPTGRSVRVWLVLTISSDEDTEGLRQTRSGTRSSNEYANMKYPTSNPPLMSSSRFQKMIMIIIRPEFLTALWPKITIVKSNLYLL